MYLLLNIERKYLIVGKFQYPGGGQMFRQGGNPLKTNIQLQDELESGLTDQIHSLGLAAKEVPIPSSGKINPGKIGENSASDMSGRWGA